MGNGAGRSGTTFRGLLHRAAVVSALVGCVCLIYAKAGSFGFAPLDDPSYLTENPAVRGGLSWRAAWWALTSLELGNWHPVTWLSHLLDVQLFGFDAAAHHRVSIGLHALNAALLFLVLAGMTGSLWRSALAAGLFAVHPQRVESVAWIAERKDLLAGLGFLLLLGAYTRYLRRPGPRRFAPVILWLALGLMAKPMLVTAPLVLVLLDHWPFDRLRRHAGGWAAGLLASLREKTPLMALAALSAVMTVVAQTRGEAVLSLGAIPLGARFANAAVAIIAYLADALWPSRLAFFYPYPATGHPPGKVLVAAAVLAAAAAIVVRAARRAPSLAVGWLWYLGMLVPVVGLVQVGLQARADRYTYLPMIGIAAAAVWLIPEPWVRGRRRAAAAALGALGALGALSLATSRDVGYWRDGETLYRRTLAVTADNALTHYRLGQVLADAGKWEEAIGHFRTSLALEPVALRAFFLGSFCQRRGRTAEAAELLREAVRLAPRDPRAHFVLGLTLARQGDLSSAAAEFRTAASLQPGFAEAEYQLGLAQSQLGDYEGAVASLRRSLAGGPAFAAQVHFNLGALLDALGRLDEAALEYREAVRLDPGLGPMIERP